MTELLTSNPQDEHGIVNAKAHYENIQALVAVAGDHSIPDDQRENAANLIFEVALSVLVRDGWHEPHIASEGAEEYEILLTTGGPGLRVWGQLDAHGEPSLAELQWQDWGTPWTQYRDADPDILRAFAQHFYFGG